MWQPWRRDDANDRTLNSKSRQNRNKPLRHEENGSFVWQLSLTLDHRLHFGLLKCGLAVADSFDLASDWALWFESKDDFQLFSRLSITFGPRPILGHHDLSGAVDDKFRFVSRQNLMSESKLVGGGVRSAMNSFKLQIVYIFSKYNLVYSSCDWFGKFNQRVISTVL